jgi:predicted lipoprotein with Yx(FWY)xxD motif
MNRTVWVVAIVLVIVILVAAVYALIGQSKPQTTTVSTTILSSQSTTILSSQNTTTIKSQTAAQAQIATMFNATTGNYLTTSSGITLYLYTKDVPYSGNSSCYGLCGTHWFPFYANISGVLPYGVNASEFGTITRTNGTMQLTYEGWPLYTYIGDTEPGQMNGQGIGGIWYVVTVPKLKYT